MFQPNRPQWVVIIIACVLVFLPWAAVAADGGDAPATWILFVLAASALVVRWLQGRRLERDEIRQRLASKCVALHADGMPGIGTLGPLSSERFGESTSTNQDWDQGYTDDVDDGD